MRRKSKARQASAPYRRRRLPKATNQRRHAMQRFSERHGLTLDAGLRNRIIKAIRNGRSTPVRRQSHRVSIHDVDLDGRMVRVVYDRKRGEIVTCLTLPPDSA
jgi:hypothetical protein